MSDRYLKVILTVIALELGWLGVKDVGTPVSAQATVEPTPVILRGIEMKGRLPNALPIYQTEPLSIVAERPILVEAQRPLPIESVRPLQIDGSVPLRIHADRPIPVENVGYKPGARPGE